MGSSSAARNSGGGPVRLELALLAVFSAIWILAILAGLGVLPLAGILDLDLYRYYSISAVLGWVAGNIYVSRTSAYQPRFRRPLLLSYLIQPLSFVYLLRTLAPMADQRAAPLVPIYSFCVYGLFFLVPLTLRATRTPRRGFRDR